MPVFSSVFVSKPYTDAFCSNLVKIDNNTGSFLLADVVGESLILQQNAPIFQLHLMELEDLTTLLEAAQRLAKDFKLSTIKFILFPNYYLIHQYNQVKTIIENHGFICTSLANNYVIALTNHIELQTKKTNRLCAFERHYPVFEVQQNPIDLVCWHNLYRQSRLIKGYDHDLSIDNFKSMAAYNAECYYWFSVSINGVYLAQVLCVAINDKVLYTYLSSTNAQLCKGVFNLANAWLQLQIAAWAKTKNFEILDLGTAGVGNITTQSVAHFKVGFGAKIGYKAHFCKIV